MEKDKGVQRGFNNGYLIHKFKPELAKSMMTILTDREDEYAIGMIKGMQQHQKEQIKTQQKTVKFHKSPVSKTPNKSKDKDRDKDFEKG